jgi:hypothetical protein
VRFRSPVRSPAQRSVLARVTVGALLSGSVIAAAVAIAASLGLGGPGGNDREPSAQSTSTPHDSALAWPDVERRDARTDRDGKKKKPRQNRQVFVASGVRVMAPQGLVVPAAPVTPAQPAVPVDETASAAPKPQRPAAKLPAAKRPPAPAAVSAPLALPASAGAQATADRSTRLVRLSVESVAVAPNAASKPELLVKMGINGAHPGDAVPDTVTLHLLPQVPATVPKDDPTLALTARVDMVEAPRSAPTDPALRMRVRMAIAPAESGTPMVQEPGPGDGRSNVIALTVSLASFSDTPTGGTPGPSPDPDQPGPVDPAPEQPGTGGPGPDQPAPVDPAPEQPAPVDPAPVDPAPVDPAPIDPAPEQPTAGAPTTAPIAPIEIIIPIGPERPNSGSTTVPITPGTGNAPAAAPIPIDVVLEELPPDELPPDAIPVDVVLEELPPYDPPADPATVPTPGTEEPAVDVPAPPADPEPAPEPDPASAGAALAVSAPASADAAAHDTGS